jgi:hypothetical protein
MLSISGSGGDSLMGLAQTASTLIERKHNEETLDHIKIKPHSQLYLDFCISSITGL